MIPILKLCSSPLPIKAIPNTAPDIQPDTNLTTAKPTGQLVATRKKINVHLSDSLRILREDEDPDVLYCQAKDAKAPVYAN